MPQRPSGRRTGENPPENGADRRSRPTAVKPFYDMQIRVILGGEPAHLTTCATCCAVVPSGAKAQARHSEWHRLLQAAIDSALPR